MKFLYKGIIGLVCALFLPTGIVFAYNDIDANNPAIKTNMATYIFSDRAVLNGAILNNPNISSPVYSWFQWGTTTSYENETAHQAIGYSGPFNQNIANLSQNTIYHYRAAIQIGNNAPIYGNDMAFITGIVLLNPPANSQVLGASDISTGVTNNIVKDSFFMPLFLIFLMSWLYFTGKIYRFADWLKTL